MQATSDVIDALNYLAKSKEVVNSKFTVEKIELTKTVYNLVFYNQDGARIPYREDILTHIQEVYRDGGVFIAWIDENYGKFFGDRK